MKYPKYIITTDGYIGTFQRVDPGDFPIYRFPGGDRVETDTYTLALGADTREQVKINRILRELHNAGGCDATTDYDKGWDCATDNAIGIVEKITGTKITDLLERIQQKAKSFFIAKKGASMRELKKEKTKGMKLNCITQKKTDITQRKQAIHGK